MNYINRRFIQSHPDWLFVFGDNLLEKGLGGQAYECRYEPNTCGIPTKKAPTNLPSHFFTDDEFESNIAWIDIAVFKIQDKMRANLYTKLVILPNIGRGRACLDSLAPKTFTFLQERIFCLVREFNQPGGVK